MSTRRTTGEIFDTVIDDVTNTVSANNLFSSTTKIDVSSSLAPSTGQVLTAISSTAATWQSPVGGNITKWIFGDVKTTGTSGGTFTAGAWQIRTLNTDLYTPLMGAGDVTRSGNVITVQPGLYFFESFAPAIRVLRNQSRLFNITDNNVEAIGTSEYSGASTQHSSIIKTVLDLATAKSYRVEHRCQTTFNTVGFGVASGFASTSELYTIVVITKIG